MKKLSLCFAVFSIGLFVSAASANAQEWTLSNTLGENSAYSISGSGEQNFSNSSNYQIDIDTDALSGENTTFSSSNDSGTTGSATIRLPNGDKTLYYTYTQPEGYTTVTKPLSTTDLSNKTYSIDPYQELNAAIRGVSDSSLVLKSDFVAKPSNGEYGASYGVVSPNFAGIEGDFIGNYVVTASTDGGEGAAIFMAAIGRNLGYIKGDFINNYVRAKRTAAGGAIYNAAFNTIGSITGNFIGNHINNYNDYVINGSLGKGGAIFNNATIGDITGNFVGNYIWTTFPQSWGGAIANNTSGTIGNIEGDFIGNFVYAKGTTPRDQGNGDVYGGAIYSTGDSTIESIKGDFIGNFVSGTTNNVFGGAIYAGTSGIGSIESNFIGNYAYAATSTNVAGGAIYTDTGQSVPLLSGEFLGNYAYGKSAYGGAIANRGNMTLENAVLQDNYAKSSSSGSVKGGAIWSLKTMNLNSTDGYDFLIKGNYVENASGRKNEAIYMDYITTTSGYEYGTLNVNATNSGTFTIYDNINGGKSYRFYNIGDGTGKVDMYGFIDGTSVFRTNDIDFHYHQLDNVLTTTNFSSINIDTNTSHFYYYIDVDANTQKADMLKATYTSNGRVILNGINLMGGTWNTLDESFIAQVLDVPTDAIQLVLGEDLENMTNQILSSGTFSETDTVEANTDWSKIFKSREGTRVTKFGLGLATTHTTNDSIGFSTRTTETSSETILGDTLAMVAADTTNPVKTFTTTNPNTVYVLGNLYDVPAVGNVKGNLTVRGAVSGNQRSAIDLNNKGGFRLQNTSATLTLKDVTIKNANYADYGAVENSGILNIDNVHFINNTGPFAGAAIRQTTATGQINYIRNSLFSGNSATSGGGAIAAGTLIKEITNSSFLSNTAVTAGGAISLECGEIQSIVGTLLNGNSAGWGGGLYVGTHATLGGINNSVFTGNSGSFGGAIYYNGYIASSETSSFGNITNTNFVDNHATAKGGAIYSTNDISIIANSGSSTFSGNYVGSADNRQAIYMDNASSSLTLNAVNNGVINMNDYVTGESGYATSLTGNNTGVINLYNNILNSVVTTSGAVTINTANNDLFTYELLSLDSNSNTNYSIDIDVSQRLADMFETTNLSSGTITLTQINVVAGSFDDVNDAGFKIQVINNNNISSTLQLALATEISNREFYLYSTPNGTSSDAIRANNDWSDKYKRYENTNDVYGKIGLATTRTTNDSIGVVEASTVASSTASSLGDTLVLVANDTTNQVKTFTTSNSSAVYTLGSEHNVTGVGDVRNELTIQGTVNGNNRSTINLNNKDGFEVTGDATLNLKNITVKNAAGIGAVKNIGTFNASNVIFEDNASQTDGGAIWSQQDVHITADNGVSGFSGNYVGSSNNNQAIYMNNASSSLTLNAVNNGVINMNDYVTGESGYATTLSGNNTGVINLYNNILNSVVTTSGEVTVNTANNDLFTYELLALNSSTDTDYSIDVDVSQRLADVFETTNLSSGTITLTQVNVVAGSFDDVNDAGFKIQVINNNNISSTLQLALATEISNREFYLYSTPDGTSADAIRADNDWSDTYNQYEHSNDIYGKIGLATTRTTNDSIGVVEASTIATTTSSSLGDTLVLVANDTTNPVKTFTTSNSSAVYTLGSEHNVTGVGEVQGQLSVKGFANNTRRSTIDLNNKSGFEVVNTARLNLEDVSVKNAANIGAVTNDGTLNTDNVIFAENASSGNGGAVLNNNQANIRNSSFVDNHAANAGGAIWSNADVQVTADNGTSTFSGNYVGSADNRQAIYMNNASSSLTLNAVNNGVINMNDYVSGENGYATTLSGDNTGVINLYNNILNSVVTTDGAVTINTANNDLFTYSLLSLDSSSDTNYSIDIDVSQKLADVFATTNLSSGVITLAELNVIAGNFADVTDESFKIQIIDNNNSSSTLQLALKNEISDREFLINDAVVDSSDDEVQVDTDWTDIYNTTDDTRKTYGKIGLATTDTENDSIGVVITRAEDDTEQNPLGDTLALVSGADLEERNFNTSDAGSTYTLTENLGDAAEGTLNINGTADEEQRSTLDMNSMSGFVLSSETTLNFNNVEIVNGSGAVIDATNNNAEINLTNVNLTQNQSSDAVISANANVNIVADAQTSNFANNEASNVIYVDGASLNLSAQNSGVVTFDDNIAGNNYDVNILGDDSGEVRFNNHVSAVDNLVFDNGAVAAVGLNANISADAMYQTSPSATSTLIVDIEVDKAAKTTKAGLIELIGQLSGNYNVVVNPANDDIYDDAYALFLSAPNDTDSSDESFTVTRVYGNPYLWQTKRNIQDEDVGSMWYLALKTEHSDTTPSDTTPSDTTPSDTTPSDTTPSDTTPSEVIPTPPAPRPVVAPEVIAALGLHEAAIEQNRSVARNVKSKVAANRYYCNDCHISYDRYWRGRQLKDLWVLAQGETANIDAPVELEAKIYDVEAGFDVQSDIHNTLGVFASYRKGDYDVSGKNDIFAHTGGSSMDIDSWLAGLYYRYDRNMTWVFATLYGGIQKADIKTDDGVAKFDTDGTQFGGSIEVGHSFLLKNNFVLDPSLGVYYTQVNFDDAKDNVGKEYSWDEIKHLEIELGAKLEKQMFRGDVYIKPSVVQTVTNGDSVFITGLGNIDGTYEDQTLFRIEVGGRYDFNRNTYGYAWANYTVGSEYDAIAAGLGLNYAW